MVSRYLKGGALKKVSHYLYPKGEALKMAEGIIPLCFFLGDFDDRSVKVWILHCRSRLS